MKNYYIPQADESIGTSQHGKTARRWLGIIVLTALLTSMTQHLYAGSLPGGDSLIVHNTDLQNFANTENEANKTNSRGDFGSRFTPKNLLRDVRWNKELHCLEFSILVQDDWGTGKNDAIWQAKVSVNGVEKFMIKGPNSLWMCCNPDEVAHVKFTPLTDMSEDYGKMFVLAQGASVNKEDCPRDWWKDPYYLYEINFDNSKYFWCSEIPGYSTYYFQYARFRYYPPKPIVTGETMCVKVSDVILIEEGANGATKKVKGAQKTVTVAMPPGPTNQSLSGGEIQQGGGLRFTANATGATSIVLMKNDGKVEARAGQNTTFEGKYLATEDEFLKGVAFGFCPQKEFVKDATTTYQWTSSEICQSQRSGVFTGNLATTLSTCGQVKLRWQMKNPDSTTNVNTAPFILQVKKGSGGWADVSTDITYENKATGTSDYEFIYQLPDNDLNKGTVDYEFRIKRQFADWDDPVLGNLFQRNAIVKINTDYKGLKEYAMEPAIDKYPRITWTFDTEGIECSNNISLKLTVGNTETEIPKDSIVKATPGYQTTASNGVINCTPQRYSLILQYSNLPAKNYVVNDNYVYTPTGKRAFEKVTVSKGYHSDHNSIKWLLKKGWDEFDSFQLERWMIGSNDTIVVSDHVHKAGKLLYTYEDYNINVGKYYGYRVKGLYHCFENEGSITSSVEVGFSQPYGSVSGRVTYSGNSAVRNARIWLNTTDALKGNRELEFSSDRFQSFVDVPANKRMFAFKGFSFQVWLKPMSGENACILFSDNCKLYLHGDTGMLSMTLNENDKQVFTDYGAFPKGEYSHLTATAEPIDNDYTTYRIKLYVNGRVNTCDTIHLSSPLPENASVCFLGNETKENNRASNIYDGLMDDIRFWDLALTEEEILLNYDRVLSGKEKGLATYLKCDEVNTINSDLFDISADGVNFNGNHAKKGSGVERRDVAIEATHLSIKGLTDESGIYQIINVIPFTNDGTTYTVTPELGIHEFDPHKRPLYFSPDSRVFNNVDFSDVSSFPVSGRVVFANSEFPVDSVVVYIDGMPANKDGSLVMTNADGEFCVDVPIGEHFIEVKRNGHIFADNGRFPKDPNKVGVRYNFQEKISDLRFTDQTTVRLIGKVVGGDSQAKLPIGFGLSKANIGKAIVQLQAVNTTNKLTVATQDSICTTTIGNKNSTMRFKPFSANERNIIEIETNGETGEFLAVLPPIPYNLIGVKTQEFEDGPGDPSIDFNYSKMVFNTNPLLVQTAKHTDTAGNTSTFDYNDSVRITRYNDPIIQVRDMRAKRGAFGDSLYVYANQATGTLESIPLYTVDSVTKVVNYLLGVPVLTQKKLMYHWEVKAFEVYDNMDGDELVSDTVPLPGQAITVNNALASMRVDIDTTTQQWRATLSGESNTELTLDSLGCGMYNFRVGFPNIYGDHQLSAKFSLEKNGRSFIWEQRGILFGQMPSDGNNFVTKGPDHVDIVLHDPPGSNSYAYIAAGSSYTKSEMRVVVKTVTFTEELTVHAGPDLTTSTGFGFAIENEHNIVADFELAAEEELVYVDNWEKNTTTTFNQQISTSADPNYVGSMADVYIGNSTNIVFGQMLQLALYPASMDETGDGIPVGDYRLFTKKVLTSNQEFETSFVFTQQHVIETQIPNIKALRNQLLIPITAPTDTVNVYFGDSKAKYFSLLPASDEHFGEPLTYVVFFNPDAEENEKVDQVQSYNTYILNWEKCIENNERSKVQLFDNRSKYAGLAGNKLYKDVKNVNRVFENVSYDAGTGLEKALEVTYEHVVLDEQYFNAGGSFGIKSGYVFSGVGLEGHVVTSASREQGWADDDHTDTKTMTFGYVLAEDESVLFAGKDAISVDVYGPLSDVMQDIAKDDASAVNLSGFTFQLRAGQTSCPWESGDSTLYYKDESGNPVLLNHGTFKIEKADIFIKSGDNVYKHATAENIPSGRDATFTLLLQNNSEANLDVTYWLDVDATTNPNGLILELDGEPLVAGRKILISYGQEISKILKVRQSSSDVLDYENIKIKLGSVCDVEDYAEATISVSFLPSSSPVTLEVSSKLVNRHTLETQGGKITFTISNYDKSFKNFKSIRLQMKREGEDWPITALQEFDNVATLPASFSYDYVFQENTPADGRYVFRALTVSMDGVNEITSSSEEITVVKDVRKPMLLGNASPMDGILKHGGEISLTYNEDIQTGMVSKNNFTVTGILNESVRQEPVVGLHFDGRGIAFTELPIFADGSFSIEAWCQMPELQEGTLFAYGTGENRIALCFDNAGHAVVSIGNETRISEETITPSEVWKYVGLLYNRDEKTVSFFVFEGEKALIMMNKVSFATNATNEGKLLVGNNSDSSQGFHGTVGRLHFYSGIRTLGDMNSSKNLTKSSDDPRLHGLWEMEEGQGTIAIDKVRSRHLIINTPWYLSPVGKSLAFDGKNTYATVPSATYPFGVYDDFTWEFWFRANNVKASTLLSVGKTIQIGFADDGKMVLTVNGTEQPLSPYKMMDGQWHHFALSVKRTGKTMAIIDGTVTASFSSSLFNGKVEGFYYLGAKCEDLSYSGFFDGNIDELRVWATALPKDNILLKKNNMLRGTEAGLLAYYPFERWEKRDQTWEVYESLADAVSPALTIGNMTTWDNKGAPVKEVRPVTNIPFDVAASNRKIVIKLLEDDYKLEGATLDFTASEIYDMNNNSSDVVAWTAFVNQNALNWMSNPIEFTIAQGKRAFFEASIVNAGSQTVEYTIENMPSWLSTTDASGVLPPLATRHFTIEVPQEVNVGAYETMLTLAGSNNVKKTLPVQLKVTGEQPEWVVNPNDYEHSMTATGQLFINGIPLEDNSSIMAAFIDDKCVGKASPQYFPGYQAYLVFMNIMGNDKDVDKTITFKLWNASTGQVYQGMEASFNKQPISFQFNPGNNMGTPKTPLILNTSNRIEQRLEFNKGWNWVSLYVKPDDMTTESVFSNHFSRLTKIRGPLSSYDYVDAQGTWTGDLLDLNNTDMYLIYARVPFVMTVSGTAINTQVFPIKINPGWNAIGYTPAFSMSIDEAFAGLNPNDGDMVQCMNDYAVYEASIKAWMGSLKIMKPGSGYKYYSNATQTKTFVYPPSYASNGKGGFVMMASRSKSGHFKPVDAGTYPSNMFLFGRFIDRKQALGNVEIAAFVNGECRATGNTDSEGNLRLLIPGDALDGEVSFKAYVKNKEVCIRQIVPFVTDGIMGKFEKPFVISMSL